MQKVSKKKVIEDWFPIEKVGEEGRKEKTKSIGRIPSLHQYHARRPTCAMRAVILSSLLDVPEDTKEYNRIKAFINQYCERFVPDTVTLPALNGKLREKFTVKKALNYFLENKMDLSKIKLVDPFAGGGSIPHEAAFLGLDLTASDINPVAVLINKATVEFPVRFPKSLYAEIFDSIKLYANTIQERLDGALGHLYENPVNPENTIVFYIWARIVPCQNQKCGLEIPMFKSLVLNKKKKYGLVPSIPENYSNKKIDFSISWPKDTKKLNGFYSRGAITCPRCKTTTPKEDVHEYFKNNTIQEKIFAIFYENKEGERLYRSATEEDNALFRESKEIETKFDLNHQLPEKVWIWPAQCYGLSNLSEMFNRRQFLIASTISSLIQEYTTEIQEKYGEGKAEAIITFLQFALDKMVDYNSKYCIVNSGTSIVNTWTRPGLFMTGQYSETNPLANSNLSGNWLQYLYDLEKVFDNLTKRVVLRKYKPDILQMDAQHIEMEENSVDYVITDPPYYDSIPYAADSDFFYAWDKETLANIFPELFFAEETPKDQEIVADANLRGGAKQAKYFYEIGLSKAFSEMYRILKPDGLAVVVFANKKMDAWETLINAFIDSGFIITATWPVPMESRSGKLGANVTAQLTSVVLVIARKIDKEKERYFDRKFQAEINDYIEAQMKKFWNEGIRGADFFMCAIGPALTYFTKYEQVLDPSSGNQIPVARLEDTDENLPTYLEFVQGVQVNFAVKQITSSFSTGEIDKITQFYLVWRWGYGLNLLPFDEVKKLYQALLVDFKDLDEKLIKRQKKKAVYDCMNPNTRFKDTTRTKLKKFKSDSMIDYIQLSCFLWEQDTRDLLEEKINVALLKYSDGFWAISQALYDILPECSEASQLQGLLQRYKKFKPSERKVGKKKVEKDKPLDSFME